MSFTSPWKIIPLTRAVFRKTLMVPSRDGVRASGAVTSLGSVKDILGAEFLDVLLIDFRLPVEIPLQLRLGLQMSCQQEQQRRECVLMCFNSSAWHSVGGLGNNCTAEWFNPSKWNLPDWVHDRT